MTGDELNRRIAAHECVQCGAAVYDWATGMLT